MPQISLKNKRIIGGEPYFIAELNSSHNGDIETAKKMCLAAKDAGCDAVKFQSWSAESLYSKSYYDKNPISKRIVQKFAIKPSDLKDLAEYCKSINIDFSSTPYSNLEVDFLANELNAPFIKIASMEINNYDFLRYIAAKNLPMILSTGMAEKSEVEKAVEVIENTGNKQLILLHCISIYPAPFETINLRNILWLKEAFKGYPVGFSDHTLGTCVACGAIALGACVVEKHFTLDKSKMGMDNNMAIEPDEMAQLVKDCKSVFKALGTKERIILDAEYKQRENMRRSVIATRNLATGTRLKREDLGLKRPGSGISAADIESLVGRELKRDIEADCLILCEDLR